MWNKKDNDLLERGGVIKRTLYKEEDINLCYFTQ